MNTAPCAFFDALTLCEQIESALASVVGAEVHLFGYLASVLAMYCGEPSSAWGYQFAITPDGYPFSSDLQEAMDVLVAGGSLGSDGDGCLRITTKGQADLGFFRELANIRDNEQYVRGACGALLTMPVGLVRQALLHDADLARGRQVSSAALLPTQIGCAVRQDHFRALHMALPSNPGDLMVPAVVWLTYLAEASKGAVADGPES